MDQKPVVRTGDLAEAPRLEVDDKAIQKGMNGANVKGKQSDVFRCFMRTSGNSLSADVCVTINEHKSYKFTEP
jgi:hypothetical protein